MTEEQREDRVRRLEAAVTAGNAHDDHDCWAEAYAIAIDTEFSINHRARAIRKMDHLTGESEAIGDDEQVVRDYMLYADMYGMTRES